MSLKLVRNTEFKEAGNNSVSLTNVRSFILLVIQKNMVNLFGYHYYNIEATTVFGY